ncbi:hypothetical protein IPA_05960 [Ignicoccus pacificus DSM 13166]|uniref:Uncharacterized protein n=1 Tax=Ignicoccus pacificus DSM 13166 TaxID=940294 RepID=A0A977PL09_9CREN|nr:hypothetical protein IPA_05960 [Ignicoccus pacificus DSM 13166]
MSSEAHLFGMIERGVLEALLDKLSMIIGDVSAKQLLFKTFKEVGRDYAKEMEEGDFCDIAKKLYGDHLVSCEKDYKEIKIKLKSCPLANIKSLTPNKCVLPIALCAGLVEGLSGKKVKVIAPSGRYGVLGATLTMKVESCGRYGNDCLIKITDSDG